MSPGRRADVIVAGVAAAVVAIVAYRAVATLDPRFLDPTTGADVWFEGDLPRVVGDMTHRWAPHARASVHPLFGLLSVVAVYALRGLGASPMVAVGLLVALAAGAWTLLLFTALRLAGRRPSVAALFTGLGVASGGAVFWLTVPETYAFGSAAMLAAVAVAGLDERRRLADGWLMAASAGTLAVTITNAMAGMLAALACRPWRRAVQISVNAFALVVALWAVQRLVVPRADFFIGYTNEQRYLLRAEGGGAAERLRVLLVDSVVVPSLGRFDKPHRGPILSVQHSRVTGSTLSAAAGLSWLGLLAAGLRSIARRRGGSRVERVSVALVLGQLTLHLLYGTETFLYVLNVTPWLILIASASVESFGPKWRQAAVALVILTTCLVGFGNLSRWHAARAWFLGAEQRPFIRSSVMASERESMVTHRYSATGHARRQSL